MTCVPGELLDHGKQCPSHADFSLARVVHGVVKVEAGHDFPRSLACALELGDDISKQLVVGDSEGALVAARVPIAFEFIESCPNPLKPDPFRGSGMLDQRDRSCQRGDEPSAGVSLRQASYSLDQCVAILVEHVLDDRPFRADPNYVDGHKLSLDSVVGWSGLDAAHRLGRVRQGSDSGLARLSGAGKRAEKEHAIRLPSGSMCSKVRASDRIRSAYAPRYAQNMARNVVFDPTDREMFDAQRQRFDWSLLQNGNVYRYDTVFQLDSACTRLTDLGYLVHRVDAHSWTNVEDMHTAFAKTMSFPSYYGRNLDAFADVLSDVASFAYGSDPTSLGTVLAISGYDTFARIDRRTATAVLDIFSAQARLAALYAHPMLCLVESTVTDYASVGGRPVSVGSVWDVQPDPPAPFHHGDLVEQVLQIYADEASASKYFAALNQALADTLAAHGRWQILNPVLASERVATLHAENRPEPPPTGTQLWEILIGLRGAGDHTVLGDQLVHALSKSGLRFDQLITKFYSAETKELKQALTYYPSLQNSDD